MDGRSKPVGGAINEGVGVATISGDPGQGRSNLCEASTLVVDLEEADSSSVRPLDLSAGSACWDSGPTEAQVNSASNGNTYLSSHQSAELRVGEAPLLGHLISYPSNDSEIIAS